MLYKKIAKPAIMNNKELKCLNCGQGTFYRTEVSSNQGFLATFGLEFFANRGVAFDCEACGYRHTFFKY